ncbi:MAG TPA: phosphatase PAP2 family protein [Thermoleophilaceae bacterium]|nr:phosphatase PAP2 family protein [Thermoleophilaceae bacterium]
MARRTTLIRGAAFSALALAFALPKLRERFDLPRALGFAAWLGPPAASVALPRGRARGYATFMAQMWAYLRSFELAYAAPERLAARLRVEYPIVIDRRLGLGHTPTERLQRWRADAANARLVDRALGAVYFAWAPERQAGLLWILLRHPRRFARAAALVSGAFDVGWVLYTAFPTAPPWWAGKVGALPGVTRATVDASRALPLVPEENERDRDQGNPWASTPSTHTASAAMLAIVLAELDPRAGLAAGGYLAALGLALVYLGEHYLFDVLTGLGLALAVRLCEPLARPPARRIAAAFDALSDAAWSRRRRLPWR